MNEAILIDMRKRLEHLEQVVYYLDPSVDYKNGIPFEVLDQMEDAAMEELIRSLAAVREDFEAMQEAIRGAA